MKHKIIANVENESEFIADIDLELALALPDTLALNLTAEDKAQNILLNKREIRAISGGVQQVVFCCLLLEDEINNDQTIIEKGKPNLATLILPKLNNLKLYGTRVMDRIDKLNTTSFFKSNDAYNAALMELDPKKLNGEITTFVTELLQAYQQIKHINFATFQTLLTLATSSFLISESDNSRFDICNELIKTLNHQAEVIPITTKQILRNSKTETGTQYKIQFAHSLLDVFKHQPNCWELTLKNIEEIICSLGNVFNEKLNLYYMILYTVFKDPQSFELLQDTTLTHFSENIDCENNPEFVLPLANQILSIICKPVYLTEQGKRNRELRTVNKVTFKLFYLANLSIKGLFKFSDESGTFKDLLNSEDTKAHYKSLLYNIIHICARYPRFLDECKSLAKDIQKRYYPDYKTKFEMFDYIKSIGSPLYEQITSNWNINLSPKTNL